LSAAAYIPLQQHLSIVFFVRGQSSFPSFCGTQQHFVSSFPVNVQLICGDAAEMSVALASVATKPTILSSFSSIHLLQLRLIFFLRNPGTGGLFHFLQLLAATAARILIAAFTCRGALDHFDLASAFRVGAAINFAFLKCHDSSPPFDFVSEAYTLDPGPRSNDLFFIALPLSQRSG